MTDPVRTDIPVQLDIRSLENIAPTLDVQGTVGVNAIANARTALQAAFKSYAEINDVEAQLRKANPQPRLIDGRTVHVASHPEFGKAAHESFKRAAPAIDGNLKQLNGIATVLQERVDNAIKDPTATTPHTIALGQEIRAYSKGLSPTERIEFVRNAITSGDKRTVNALLSSPGYLSGMDASSLDNLRAQASMQLAKQDYLQLGAVKDAIGRVERAHSLLMGRVEKARKLSETPLSQAEEALKKLAAG
jgi:hypothetical protein